MSGSNSNSSSSSSNSSSSGAQAAASIEGGASSQYKAGPGNPAVKAVYLVARHQGLDQKIKVLEGPGQVYLGRGPPLNVDNQKCSRKQALLVLEPESTAVHVKMLGLNAMYVHKFGQPPKQLPNGECVTLEHGNSFSLVAHLHKYHLYLEFEDDPINRTAGKRARGDANDDDKGSDAKRQRVVASSGTDTRPECKYGRDCFRKNPAHFAKYRHAHLDDNKAAGKDADRRDDHQARTEQVETKESQDKGKETVSTAAQKVMDVDVNEDKNEDEQKETSGTTTATTTTTTTTTSSSSSSSSSSNTNRKRHKQVYTLEAYGHQLGAHSMAMGSMGTDEGGRALDVNLISAGLLRALGDRLDGNEGLLHADARLYVVCDNEKEAEVWRRNVEDAPEATQRVMRVLTGISLAEMNSSGHPCRALLFESNWRFKVAAGAMYTEMREVDDALGARVDLTALSKRVHRAGEPGGVYPVEVPSETSLASEQHVQYVVHVIPPNRNPRMVDFVSEDSHASSIWFKSAMAIVDFMQALCAS